MQEGIALLMEPNIGGRPTKSATNNSDLNSHRSPNTQLRCIQSLFGSIAGTRLGLSCVHECILSGIRIKGAPHPGVAPFENVAADILDFSQITLS
ncbi:hypothetical protein [Microvirga sp. KLBC 81]|uniref:hypothetical protein n=1 Tax=Microvirga sp. KLBC 81 TaxID=1862707 RepID=UPI001058364F|nr:hypothetical protein [Microvirga sp. KLBC 81]